MTGTGDARAVRDTDPRPPSSTVHSDIDAADSPVRTIGALALICRQFEGEAPEVLLVKPTYGEHWQLVGGTALADEMPHAACARQIRESTGLKITPGRPLVVDYVPADPARDVAEELTFVYDSGSVPWEERGRIRLPEAEPGQKPELSAYAFAALDELSAQTALCQERRIRTALAALKHGTTVYLIGGKALAPGIP